MIANKNRAKALFFDFVGVYKEAHALLSHKNDITFLWYTSSTTGAAPAVPLPKREG